jgi:WD40 repeat protein
MMNQTMFFPAQITTQRVPITIVGTFAANLTVGNPRRLVAYWWRILLSAIAFLISIGTRPSEVHGVQDASLAIGWSSIHDSMLSYRLMGTFYLRNAGRVAISPDARYAATMWATGLHVYRLPRIQLMYGFRGLSKQRGAAAISFDGSTLVATCVQGDSIVIRELLNGARRGEPQKWRDVSSLALSLDAGLIAIGGTKVCVVVETQTGREVGRLEGLAHPVCGLAFTSDRKGLALVQQEQNSISLLSLPSLSPEQRFWIIPYYAGHNGRVGENEIRSVAVSWDKGLMAGGCQDGSIRLWDIQSGSELMPVVGHNLPVVAVAFGSGLRQLTSVDSGGFGCVWDIGKPVASAMEANCKGKGAKELWSLLFGFTPEIAARAKREMVSRPTETVNFLKTRLRAVDVFSISLARDLIGRLSNDGEEKSATVIDELVSLGECAEIELKAQVSDGVLFARKAKAERLAKAFEAVRNSRSSGDRMRDLESIEVLGQIDSPEAWALLTELAGGEATSRMTQRAKEKICSLERRSRR